MTVAGCAADTPGGDDGGGDDDGGGGGGGGGEQPPPPLTPAGRFTLTSEFDLATNAPGRAGEIATYFLLATDDPDDPTAFIVEQLINQIPNETIKTIARTAAPVVTGYLNERLLDIAPDFFDRLVAAGNKLGQVTRRFGTIETLEVTAGGQAVTTVRGLHFVIDGVAVDYAFRDYGLEETRVEGLTVAVEQTGKLTISNHKVGLRYGQVLRLALDQAVIPLIDPGTTNLSQLFLDAVNCRAVGQFVFEVIELGSAGTYETACKNGLTAAAGALYRQIENIDSSALELGLAGVANGVDRNRDGKLDDILTGTWTGTLDYAGQPAPLGVAKFHGKQL